MRAKPKTPKANAEVRRLLVELNQHFGEFYNLTAKIVPGSGISDQEAVSAGADREHVRARILGCACRIHRASLR